MIWARLEGFAFGMIIGVLLLGGLLVTIGVL